jgi:hypothetical protein
MAATRAGQLTQASLVAGEPEHLRDGLGPIDQIALHLLQAETTLLRLEHLIRGPRLHEGHGARSDRLAVLAQGVSHRAHRRLGHRLHSGSRAASLPGAGLRALLRLIGVVRPCCLDLRGVPGAVRLAADATRLLGPPHCRLAYPELPGELPIAGPGHP